MEVEGEASSNTLGPSGLQEPRFDLRIERLGDHFCLILLIL
jgi:hypothetical protein